MRFNSDRLTIKEKPAARDVYWIKAGDDAWEPEFTGYHPGVIIRGANSLDLLTETVSFVPMTTKPPRAIEGRLPKHVYRMPTNPNPGESCLVWVVCNHIMTARLTRLERFLNADKNGQLVPRISKEDFQNILECIRFGYAVIGNYVKETIAHEKDKQFEDRIEAEVVRRLAQRHGWEPT